MPNATANFPLWGSIPMIEKSGSLRVDLLGGTLDLWPVNLILPGAITINCAITLKSKVVLQKGSDDGIKIVSQDYGEEYFFPKADFNCQKLREGHFASMGFVAQILQFFKIDRGLSLRLTSQAPPGAGLGGSSVMGITLFRALCEWMGMSCRESEALAVVSDIEASILDAGATGKQDYYPALYGGVLGLIPQFGKVKVEQLFSHELKDFLEEHLTLVYSGQMHSSGMNNWEVYKNFFDRHPPTRQGLGEIAQLSEQAYQAIGKKKFTTLLELIGREGERRATLFPEIVTPKVGNLYTELQGTLPHLGMKICGAGGGGSFVFVHRKEDRKLIAESVSQAQMQILPFSIDGVIQRETGKS